MMLLASERTILARYHTEDGEIQLQQRRQGDGSIVFEIIINGVFLMASYNQSSARALATYALDKVPGDAPRVMIGGLGMGFTLQEALTGSVAAVDIVEISSHIIAWNRSHFAALNGDVLADPRVHIVQADLYTVMMSTSSAPYEAILLDVDNGPSWLAYEGNARFYTAEGLIRWKENLAPGGVLGAWSAQREPAFMARMEAVFGQAEELVVEEDSEQSGLATCFLYFGQV